jgi:hypothetical protein
LKLDYNEQLEPIVKIREKLASKVAKPPRSRRFKKKENGDD